jgi:hypothetical protein
LPTAGVVEWATAPNRLTATHNQRDGQDRSFGSSTLPSSSFHDFVLPPGSVEDTSRPLLVTAMHMDIAGHAIRVRNSGQ